MGRRKVALKKRAYTFGQCDTLMHRRLKSRGPNETHAHRLYGNVQLETRWNYNYFSIVYSGKQMRFEIARIYRASDGDTLYVVYGVGCPASVHTRLFQDRERREKQLALWRKVWRRCAPAFTPIGDATGSTLGAISLVYRVRDGVSTPCDMPRSSGVPTGVWLARPSCYLPSREEWTSAFATYQNFPRRARLFATNLKKSLTHDQMGVVQLLRADECNDVGVHWKHAGVSLHVCTPPTRTANGKRLQVKMAMHDAESRPHFHIDGDYAIKHSQFFALEEGKKRSEMMRWKCAKDAINGIREWMFGDIYIPGPG